MTIISVSKAVFRAATLDWKEFLDDGMETRVRERAMELWNTDEAASLRPCVKSVCLFLNNEKL